MPWLSISNLNGYLFLWGFNLRRHLLNFNKIQYQKEKCPQLYLLMATLHQFTSN